MIDRQALHQLVDNLPEEVLPFVVHGLQLIQTWPPVIPGAEKMREQMEGVLGASNAKLGLWSAEEYRDARGVSMGTPATSSFAASAHGWAQAMGAAQGEDLHVDIYQIEGQEIQIEWQVRVSTNDRKAHYTVYVKGPDGTEVRREMNFEMTENPHADLNHP
jgi:hypothetical protein